VELGAHNPALIQKIIQPKHFWCCFSAVFWRNKTWVGSPKSRLTKAALSPQFG